MRNPFFDILKFFAIMLVVYGHVAGAFGCSFGNPYVSNFIVGMNMPLFFVISGYFAAKTIENGDWKKLFRHIYGYFWPVAVVSGVFAVIACCMHLSGSEKGLIGYAGRNFLFSPWFLWCLAPCFALTFLCYRPKLVALRFGAFLLLFILLPFVTKVWHANEVRAMLPFFLVGVFVFRRWAIWENVWAGLLCLCAYGICVIFQGDISSNGLSFYSAETSWKGFVSDCGQFFLYVARILNGVVGVVGIMWAQNLFCNYIKGVKILAPLGTTTLWVYILHQWLLARIKELSWHNSSLGCALLWTLLIFAFCHVIGLCVMRMVSFVQSKRKHA